MNKRKSAQKVHSGFHKLRWDCSTYFAPIEICIPCWDNLVTRRPYRVRSGTMLSQIWGCTEKNTRLKIQPCVPGWDVTTTKARCRVSADWSPWDHAGPDLSERFRKSRWSSGWGQECSFRAWISYHIQRYHSRCNYLSMLQIPVAIKSHWPH